MHNVIIEISGGVAHVSHVDEGAEVYVFDWDNYRDASDDGRRQMVVDIHEKMGELARIVSDQAVTA